MVQAARNVAGRADMQTSVIFLLACMLSITVTDAFTMLPKCSGLNGVDASANHSQAYIAATFQSEALVMQLASHHYLPGVLHMAHSIRSVTTNCNLQLILIASPALVTQHLQILDELFDHMVEPLFSSWEGGLGRWMPDSCCAGWCQDFVGWMSKIQCWNLTQFKQVHHSSCLIKG